jgi:hypothetical protein
VRRVLYMVKSGPFGPSDVFFGYLLVVVTDG